MQSWRRAQLDRASGIRKNDLSGGEGRSEGGKENRIGGKAKPTKKGGKHLVHPVSGVSVLGICISQFLVYSVSNVPGV